MNSDLHNFAAHFYDRRNKNSEVRSYVIAKDTQPWFLTSFRIVYVSPLTYTPLQDVGASSRPTAPNPVVLFLLLLFPSLTLL